MLDISDNSGYIQNTELTTVQSPGDWHPRDFPVFFCFSLKYVNEFFK